MDQLKSESESGPETCASVMLAQLVAILLWIYSISSRFLAMIGYYLVSIRSPRGENQP